MWRRVCAMLYITNCSFPCFFLQRLFLCKLLELGACHSLWIALQKFPGESIDQIRALTVYGTVLELTGKGSSEYPHVMVG